MQDQIYLNSGLDEEENMDFYYDDSMENSLTHDLVQASIMYEEAEKNYLFAKKHYLEAQKRLADWQLGNLEYDFRRLNLE